MKQFLIFLAALATSLVGGFYYWLFATLQNGGVA